MNRRRSIVLVFLVLAFAAVAIYVGYTKRRGAKPQRVAILNLGPYPLMETIRDQSRMHLNQTKGKTLTVDVYDANFQPEVMRTSVEQIVQSHYDVAISITTPATQMLLGRNEGRVPVVFTFVSAPAAIGYTGPTSLRNATGFFDTVPVAENLVLIRSLIAKGLRVGYVVNESEASASETYKRFESLASANDVILVKIPVSSQADVRTAVDLKINDVAAILIGPDTVVTSAIDAVLASATNKKRPVFCTDPVSVRRGCLAAVAPDYSELGNQTAEYALRILNGESANSLPVQEFQAYKHYWNQDSATRLGLTIPPSISAKGNVILLSTVEP